MTLLTDSITKLNEARVAYLIAQSYYDGSVPERFQSGWLENLLEDTGKPFRLNFAATPVDVVTERLGIATFSGADADVNAWQAIWEENQFPLEAPMVHANAGRFGDSYVIAWPDEDMATRVSMFQHGPKDVRVFYEPENPRKKSHAIHRWTAVAPSYENQEDGDYVLEPGRKYAFATLYFRDRVERWVTEEPIDTALGQPNMAINWLDPKLEYVTFTEDEENPFDLVPVYHFRNDRPYGNPEHREAYGPQDMITKTLANLMNSLDHAGYPQRFALTEQARQETFGAPGDEGGITATNRGGFAATPGGTWLIEGAKSVGQFAAMASTNFLDPINALVKWMGTVTDTPVHLFDLGGDVPSGESIDASTAPLDKKVEHRQLSYGYTWRELGHDTLLMSGLRTAGVIQVVWNPIKRATTKEQWEVVPLKVAAGVPAREALIEAGYLPTVVDQWERDEEQGALPAAPVPVQAVVIDD